MKENKSTEKIAKIQSTKGESIMKENKSTEKIAKIQSINGRMSS